MSSRLLQAAADPRSDRKRKNAENAREELQRQKERIDFHKHKTRDLKQRLKEIEKGTCKEYKEECKILDIKTEKELKTITLLREAHLKATNQLYNFDNMAARDGNHDSKIALKAQLRNAVLEEIKEIDDLVRSESSFRRVSKRNLRSKSKTDDVPNGTAHGTSCLASFRLHFPLTMSEVDEDLRIIADDWHKAALDFKKSQDFIPVVVTHGKLKYDDLVVERGSHVLIQSELTQTQTEGHVLSIRRNEIRIKCKDGKKWQVQIEHLRTGRVHLFPAGAVE